MAKKKEGLSLKKASKLQSGQSIGGTKWEKAVSDAYRAQADLAEATSAAGGSLGAMGVQGVVGLPLPPSSPVVDIPIWDQANIAAGYSFQPMIQPARGPVGSVGSAALGGLGAAIGSVGKPSVGFTNTNGTATINTPAPIASGIGSVLPSTSSGVVPPPAPIVTPSYYTNPHDPSSPNYVPPISNGLVAPGDVPTGYTGTNGNGNTAGGNQITNALPFKVGGYNYTDIVNPSAAYGRTGYVWGEGPLKGTVAGYYSVVKQDGTIKYYPLDQQKIKDYENGTVYDDSGRPVTPNNNNNDNTTPVTPNGTGSNAYSVEGAPNWWTGTLIPNATTEQQKYANMLNGSIPFMSPEDQQAAANYLATNFTEFAHYRNVAFGAPPSEITTAIREQFGSSNRANQLLNTLLKIQQASGITEDQMGPGYQYIKQVANILARFSGGAIGTSDYQSREQYLQMLTALDPLLNQAQQSGSPYGAYLPIAQNLYNPTFSAGSLWNITKNADGSYSFGSPNKQLY